MAPELSVPSCHCQFAPLLSRAPARAPHLDLASVRRRHETAAGSVPSRARLSRGSRSSRMPGWLATHAGARAAPRRAPWPLPRNRHASCRATARATSTWLPMPCRVAGAAGGRVGGARPAAGDPAAPTSSVLSVAPASASAPVVAPHQSLSVPHGGPAGCAPADHERQ